MRSLQHLGTDSCMVGSCDVLRDINQRWKFGYQALLCCSEPDYILNPDRATHKMLDLGLPSRIIAIIGITTLKIPRSQILNPITA
jgi:hypothetical protein